MWCLQLFSNFYFFTLQFSRARPTILGSFVTNLTLKTLICLLEWLRLWIFGYAKLGILFPNALSICTWFLKNQIGKIKFGELDFYCLCSLQKINVKIDFCRLKIQFVELDFSDFSKISKYRWIGRLSVRINLNKKCNLKAMNIAAWNGTP